MADNLTSEQRSRCMAAIRGRDTRPELVLRRALWQAGLRGYRLHKTILRRRPDLVWSVSRVAIFVDGAFWHGHESAYFPDRLSNYWIAKIERNIERDIETNELFSRAGWQILRLWDFDILQNTPNCVDQVSALVRESRNVRSG